MGICNYIAVLKSQLWYTKILNPKDSANLLSYVHTFERVACLVPFLFFTEPVNNFMIRDEFQFRKFHRCQTQIPENMWCEDFKYSTNAIVHLTGSYSSVERCSWYGLLLGYCTEVIVSLLCSLIFEHKQIRGKSPGPYRSQDMEWQVDDGRDGKHSMPLFHSTASCVMMIKLQDSRSFWDPSLMKH